MMSTRGNMSTFTPVGKPQTKQAYVYSTLREAIMHCKLRPGQRLIIEDIARELGVSPIPVREALHMLQSEGLVHNVAHSGSVVTPITPDSVRETFTILEGLETVAARVAAQRMQPEDIAELEAIVSKMDHAVARQAEDEWSALNKEFHTAIVKITDMPTLQEMTIRMLDRWDRIRCFFFQGTMYHRMGQSQQEHHQLLEAMKSKDYDQIENIAKIHNQQALEAYMQHIGKREG